MTDDTIPWAEHSRKIAGLNGQIGQLEAELKATTADQARLAALAANLRIDLDLAAETLAKTLERQAKLRALVPGVEAEWQESIYGNGDARCYLRCDDEPGQTALRVREDGRWHVAAPNGAVLASGTAPTLDEAKAQAEQAARSLGVL